MVIKYRTGLLLMLAIALLALPALPARADPHAVYYTATAQEQLFFNVLAALNQADYVELSGSSSATIIDNRAALESQRGPFLEPVPPQLQDTETGLSGLISRLITLEGYDLYSDYIIRQLAAEKTRIASGEELAEVACERVFGRPDCVEVPDGEAGKQAKEIATDKAFVDNPLEWNAWPLVYGAAPALFSGTKEFDDLRAYAAKPPSDPAEADRAPVPFAYSDDIVRLRKLLRQQAGTGEEPAPREEILNLMAESVIDEYLTVTNWGVGGPESYPLAEVELNTTEDVLRQGIIDWRLPNDLSKIAAAAGSRVAAQQELAQVDGSKTDTRRLVQQIPMGTHSEGTSEYSSYETGEIYLGLNNPPATKREELAAAVGFAHAADVAQQYGSPGELLEEGTGDITESGGEGVVAGATTGAGGQVAGTQETGLTPAPASINTKPAHAQGFYGWLLSLILQDRDLRTTASLAPDSRPAP